MPGPCLAAEAEKAAAAEQYRLVQEAHATLGDETKRRQYDAMLDQRARAGGGPGGVEWHAPAPAVAHIVAVMRQTERLYIWMHVLCAWFGFCVWCCVL